MLVAVQRVLLIAAILISASCLRAVEPKYVPDVGKSQEVAVPPRSDNGARIAWFYAANYSEHEWHVFIKDGRPYGQLSAKMPKRTADRPSFTPETGEFRRASAFAAVDDGWLVGFNHGEFALLFIGSAATARATTKSQTTRLSASFRSRGMFMPLRGWRIWASRRVLSFGSLGQNIIPIGRRLPLQSCLSLPTLYLSAETASC